MGINDFKAAVAAIESSKKILLVTHSRPTIDTVASLASLYTIFQDNFKKSVDVALPVDISPRLASFLEKGGLNKEKILHDLPEKTYTISIKKEGEKIESIKYDQTEDTFNFIITPHNGTLDLDSVAINETGSNYDVIITVDSPSLNFLGSLYKANASVFDSTTIISIDNHKSNTGFATYSLTDAHVDTTSQIVLKLIEDQGAKISSDVADLLFAGIVSTTDLGLRTKVRPSVYTDLGILAGMGAQFSRVHTMIYAPDTLNEIFLVGDILDSSNEGTIKGSNAKVVGCKITLNKEEIETVDLDKVARNVFWNIKMKDIGFGYIIFQKSVTESIAYVYVYDTALSIAAPMKELGGKGAKQFGTIALAVDMHAAEAKLKEVFGIELSQKTNKFGAGAFGDDFDAGFDDFGSGFGAGFDDKGLSPIFPGNTDPFPPMVPPAQSGSTSDDKGSDNTPGARFDPRLGK